MVIADYFETMTSSDVAFTLTWNAEVARGGLNTELSEQFGLIGPFGLIPHYRHLELLLAGSYTCQANKEEENSGCGWE